MFCFDFWVGHKCHTALSAALSPPCYNRPVYDNVGLKVDGHIYENVGALRDATPDLILAVKPKVSLEEEQVTERDQRTCFRRLRCVFFSDRVFSASASSV